MQAPKDISWATKEHYLHHSDPSRPLCAALYDKCVLRPHKNAAWKAVKAESDGKDEHKLAVNRDEYNLVIKNAFNGKK